MVEICKALLRDAKIIALDEPTSSLSHRETQILFRLVKDLQAQGQVLIYVSHRLEEILSCATPAPFSGADKARGGELIRKHQYQLPARLPAMGNFRK
jgi:energy-coupling factor transporter ATP-binding protein EcfA2